MSSLRSLKFIWAALWIWKYPEAFCSHQQSEEAPPPSTKAFYKTMTQAPENPEKSSSHEKKKGKTLPKLPAMHGLYRYRPPCR